MTTRLSEHFTLAEFLATRHLIKNQPDDQSIINMTFGCWFLLEPVRVQVGCPIYITSGYRSAALNALVGGVSNSQHMTGCAADIRPQNPAKFKDVVDILAHSPYVDQLLTAPTWCHVSWKPFGIPRRYVVRGYYKK